MTSKNERTAMSLQNPIYQDPFISALLKRMPESVAQSFSEQQLECLHHALTFKRGKVHPLDIRGSITIWDHAWYYVVLGGVDRRALSRRQEYALSWSGRFFIAAGLLIAICLILLTLYLVKSAFGIDIIPGHSIGLWDWLNSATSMNGD
jgi:hypothetical protein